MAGIKTGAHLYLSAAGHVDTVCLSRSLFGESVEVPNVHYKVMEWSEPGHPKRSEDGLKAGLSIKSMENCRKNSALSSPSDTD